MNDDTVLLVRVKNALHADARLGRCGIEPDGPVAAPVLYPEGYSGHIRIHVSAGAVTLDGEVESAAERAIAESVVRAIAGAKAVVNALTVTAGGCRCAAAPTARP